MAIAVIVIILSSYQNCAFVEPEHSLSSSSVDPVMLNFEGFKSTVFPVVTQNCAGCHGAGVPGAPQFAVTANPEGSFNTIIQAGVLQRNVAPAQNLIVMKIIGGGHNGISAATGMNMQNQVAAWQAGLP